MQILENELRDRSTVTSDFFDYEPDGTVIESATWPFAPGDAGDAKKSTPGFPSEIGKSIFSTRWDTDKQVWIVFLIDPATGKALPGYEPIAAGSNTNFMGQTQLSPNGTRLVVTEPRNSVSWPSGGGVITQGSVDVLHLIDVQTWREVTATLSSKDAVGILTFNNDGRQLAVTLSRYNTESASIADELVLLDASTGAILIRRNLELHPSKLEFSADGSRLMVYGQPLGANPSMDKPGPLRVVLLDRATLKTVWEHTLDGIVGGYWCESNCEASHEQMVFASWTPAVTFSPDRSKLYIVHADADKLTTVDFTARQVHSVDIAEARSWLEALLDLTASKAKAKTRSNGAGKFALLSTDGEKLYVISQKLSATGDVEEQALGLQVVEVSTGRKVASIESDLDTLPPSTDGKQLFLSGSRGGMEVTDVLDAVTLERITTIQKWVVMPLRRLDGQPILLVTQGTDEPREYGLMDPQTLKVTSIWPAQRDESVRARR
jgi:dipeptidyl aminopeptidase/acylaminoacyl peptidase